MPWAIAPTPLSLKPTCLDPLPPVRLEGAESLGHKITLCKPQCCGLKLHPQSLIPGFVTAVQFNCYGDK